VGIRVREARGIRARLLGLALLHHLDPNDALLFRRCRSVHTFGMRFRIDVVFLDERGGVLRVVRAVPRRRLLRCADAYAVLETRAGDATAFLNPPEAPPGLSRLRPRGARGGS
jgi:uncharacterized membrane protein (UPF0127 family)